MVGALLGGCGGDDDYDTPNNPKHPDGPKSRFSHHHHQEDAPTQDFALSSMIYLFTVLQRMISGMIIAMHKNYYRKIAPSFLPSPLFPFFPSILSKAPVNPTFR